MRPPGKAICPACERRPPVRSVKSSVASGSRWMTGTSTAAGLPLHLKQDVGDLRIEAYGRRRRAAIRRKPLGDAAAEILRRERGSAQLKTALSGKAKKSPPDQRPGAPSLASAMPTSSSASERVASASSPPRTCEIGLQPAGRRLRSRSAADAPAPAATMSPTLVRKVSVCPRPRPLRATSTARKGASSTAMPTFSTGVTRT